MKNGIFTLFLQGLVGLCAPIFFIFGSFFGIKLLMWAGAILLVLIFIGGMILANPLVYLTSHSYARFMIIPAIIVGWIWTPWYQGVLWVFAVFSLLDIPKYLIFVFRPDKVLKELDPMAYYGLDKYR